MEFPWESHGNGNPILMHISSQKCLLDTSVLMPKYPDTSDPSNGAEVSQRRTVSGPKCLVTVFTSQPHSMLAFRPEFASGRHVLLSNGTFIDR